MTCSHLWTPSLEPRTVVHSWYRHAMNEAAALEKEEEELNAERCNWSKSYWKLKTDANALLSPGLIGSSTVNTLTKSSWWEMHQKMTQNAHGFEDDDDDDPDLPALISESSNTPEESFSPPAETSVTSPMERHANDNTERTISSILPAMSVETRSRNNEMGGSEDFTPRNNVGELNLVLGDHYDTEDMEELDNLLPSD
ncbi:8337_t:CDS:2 [Acaulospora morrowiae]|uniref:8337_t:CDS:1 n=1 Tax=Acaulospora morrowiae TaxID=94023 RepID=A0A9N8YTN0_9GLOM|nr:8337_t:CDS:2 [Acaulospora morrowiae]